MYIQTCSTEQGCSDSKTPGESQEQFSSSSCCSSSSRKSVRFEKVEIREYNIVLGDNPSCSNGPPVSLGWYYDKDQQQQMPLDTYEQKRDGYRRASHEMKVPGYMRHDILREWDVPNREIMKAQIQCEIIQKQRSRTFQREQRSFSVKKTFAFYQGSKKEEGVGQQR